ncbi:MAG: GntR family transcriptional regulator [Actinomycetia bacterium]|nr:GntR family transcriptional regulator [Actinomycetes bacterium]
MLKEDIDAGHRQPGEVLPSEAELDAWFGISRTVIRKALDVLEADGQVIRQKGRGTVVAPPKLVYGTVAAAREWRQEDLAQQAILSELIDVRAVVAGSNLGALLKVSPADRLLEITAVAAVGHPVSLTQGYVRCDASPELSAAADGAHDLPLIVGGPELLTQLVERCGVRPQRSELTHRCGLAGENRVRPAFCMSSTTW